jgi:hypothetical protein
MVVLRSVPILQIRYTQLALPLTEPIGARGLEPPTSASRTLTFEAKKQVGINKNNLAKLSNWYLADRINTKGLTHFSQITIEGHFRQLLQDFETIPNSLQLSEWLGKRSPGARKRLLKPFVLLEGG